MLPLLAPLALTGLTGLAVAPTAYSLYNKAQNNRTRIPNLSNTETPQATVTLPTLNELSNGYDSYNVLQQILHPADTKTENNDAKTTTAAKTTTGIPDTYIDEAETAPVVRQLSNGSYAVETPQGNTDIAIAMALDAKERAAEEAAAQAAKQQAKKTTTTPTSKVLSASKKEEEAARKALTIQKPKTNSYDWLNNLLPLLAAGGLGYLLAK